MLSTSFVGTATHNVPLDYHTCITENKDFLSIWQNMRKMKDCFIRKTKKKKQTKWKMTKKRCAPHWFGIEAQRPNKNLQFSLWSKLCRHFNLCSSFWTSFCFFRLVFQLFQSKTFELIWMQPWHFGVKILNRNSFILVT